MCRRTNPGFTLIELLVVLLIFGWVLSLVIPNLSRARERARVASCEQNLKILASALEAYSANYDHQYPDHLAAMVPLQIPGIPLCPTSQTQTYASGYLAARGPSCYTLCCVGTSHANAGLPRDFPQYLLRAGLREGP